MRYLAHHGKDTNVIAVVGLIDEYPRWADARISRPG
jgi:hypothetical protein